MWFSYSTGKSSLKTAAGCEILAELSVHCAACSGLYRVTASSPTEPAEGIKMIFKL